MEVRILGLMMGIIGIILIRYGMQVIKSKKLFNFFTNIYGIISGGYLFKSGKVAIIFGLWTVICGVVLVGLAVKAALF